MENYYKFYRHAYEAVNEVNSELQPEMPLLVGGPSGFRTDEAIHLIEDFANDTSESKKLDFIAFHDFWAEDAPAQVADWEKEIDLALAKASLPINTPVFVTAIGYMHRAKDHDQTEKNLWQACGMTAYQFYARHSPDLRLIPFNQFHSWPFVKYVQFDPDLRLTPYGAAVKLLRMHRRQEVESHSSGLDQNGNGLGVLATKDEDAVIVHLWNLQPDGKTSVFTNVKVTNIPKQLRSGRLVIRRYLIDSRHSNCFVDRHSNPGLEMVDIQEREGANILKLEAELEPMAICLWQIEKAQL
jgi:hypothetical protein